MAGKEQLISHADETHDSPLRKHFDGIFFNAAKFLHKVDPGKTSPNRLSLFGAAVNLTGQIMATRESIHGRTKKGTATSIGLEITGILPDAIDGAMADIVEGESPGSRNRTLGSVLDIEMDRAEEGAGGIMRAEVASRFHKKTHDRWSKLGQLAAYGVTLTVALPTIVKAIKESQGQQVSEAGKSLLEVAGGRLGKIGLCIASNHAPYIRDKSAQPAIDLFSTGANTYAAIKRWTTDNHKPLLTKEQKRTAKYKLMGMLAYEGLAIMGVAAHYLLTRERKPKHEQEIFRATGINRISKKIR